MIRIFPRAWGYAVQHGRSHLVAHILIVGKRLAHDVPDNLGGGVAPLGSFADRACVGGSHEEFPLLGHRLLHLHPGVVGEPRSVEPVHVDCDIIGLNFVAGVGRDSVEKLIDSSAVRIPRPVGGSHLPTDILHLLGVIPLCHGVALRFIRDTYKPILCPNAPLAAHSSIQIRVLPDS